MFSVSKTNIYFVVFDIVVKNKSDVVKRGLYSCRQRYAALQFVQQIELHHQARTLLKLLSTSAAYTHGQIVDAELANQSARFALVML